jgi:hypothetical protein
MSSNLLRLTLFSTSCPNNGFKSLQIREQSSPLKFLHQNLQDSDSTFSVPLFWQLTFRPCPHLTPYGILDPLRSYAAHHVCTFMKRDRSLGLFPDRYTWNAQASCFFLNTT